jgi:hypothetical protein
VVGVKACSRGENDNERVRVRIDGLLLRPSFEEEPAPPPADLPLSTIVDPSPSKPTTADPSKMSGVDNLFLLFVSRSFSETAVCSRSFEVEGNGGCCSK